jgi:hypothetical protein
MLPLPVRLYRAHVERVDTLSRLSVRLELDLNISTRTQLRIEGVPNVPAELTNAAMRALIILVGGADVLVLTRPEQSEPLISRVYRASPSTLADYEGCVQLPGINAHRLEVALALHYLLPLNFARESACRLAKA